MYYIFQMYIPCICVVILSWVSFWIDETDGSDRVGLGIATVLTISFMRGSMNDSVPRVSYLKSVDYFLLGSFVFVFMTLIEYVLVLKQTRKEKKKKNEKNKETIARDRQREAELLFPESEDEKVSYNMAAIWLYEWTRCTESWAVIGYSSGQDGVILSSRFVNNL